MAALDQDVDTPLDYTAETAPVAFPDAVPTATATPAAVPNAAPVALADIPETAPATRPVRSATSHPVTKEAPQRTAVTKTTNTPATPSKRPATPPAANSAPKKLFQTVQTSAPLRATTIALEPSAGLLESHKRKITHLEFKLERANAALATTTANLQHITQQHSVLTLAHTALEVRFEKLKEREQKHLTTAACAHTEATLLRTLVQQGCLGRATHPQSNRHAAGQRKVKDRK